MRRRFWMVSSYALLGLLYLLLGVTLLLWGRSHWQGDFAVHYDEPRLLEFDSFDGLFRISWGELVSTNYPPFPGWQGTFWGDADSFDADLATGTRFGFGLERHQRRTAVLKSDA